MFFIRSRNSLVIISIFISYDFFYFKFVFATYDNLVKENRIKIDFICFCIHRKYLFQYVQILYVSFFVSSLYLNAADAKSHVISKTFSTMIFVRQTDVNITLISDYKATGIDNAIIIIHINVCNNSC